ncbi:MAG: iron-sulfur cluster assembly scaffold protein [Pseudomonadota bacterium]
METDLMKLYSTRILALAADIPRLGRLEAPMGTARARSPQCGSSVGVDVDVVGGRVTRFAQDVKACALGQAAAATVGAEAPGKTLAELTAARAALAAMLDGGAVPAAPWTGFEVLKAAAPFKNRHASILLALDATIAAVADADSKAA